MKGPNMPSMLSLKSLADLPDVPSPVLALVGAGDVAAQAARDLQAKLVKMDTTHLDLRDKDRRIDAASLTSTGLLWAAKGQEAYESLVARGEAIVTKIRTSESESAADEPVVAEPPAKASAAKKAAPAESAAKKAAPAESAAKKAAPAASTKPVEPTEPTEPTEEA
jgi:hypothetical protein